MSLTIFKDCFQTSQQHTRPLGTWVPKLAKHLTLIFIYSQSWPSRNKWDRMSSIWYIWGENCTTHLFFFFQYNGLQHHNDSIIGLHHYNVIKTSWNRFSTFSLSDLVEIYTALVNKADYGRKDANVQACCVCMCVIKLSVDCFDVRSLWISIFTADSDAHVRIFTSTALENRKVT